MCAGVGVLIDSKFKNNLNPILTMGSLKYIVGSEFEMVGVTILNKVLRV